MANLASLAAGLVAGAAITAGVVAVAAPGDALVAVGGDQRYAVAAEEAQANNLGRAVCGDEALVDVLSLKRLEDGWLLQAVCLVAQSPGSVGADGKPYVIQGRVEAGNKYRVFDRQKKQPGK